MKVKAASQKVNLCQITKLCSLWFSVFASLTMLRITTVCMAYPQAIKGMSD